MATIPTVEPSEIVSGDTVKWTKSLTDYLPATWTLVYSLVPQFVDAAGDAINPTTVTATDNGDSTHAVTISAATSDGLAAGDYLLVGRVNNGTEYYVVERRNLLVKPDPTDTSFDARSHVKKVLDAIDAVIEGKASKDQEATSVEGRSLSRYPWGDLLKLRDKYAALYQREQDQVDIDGGRGAAKTPRVRF